MVSNVAKIREACEIVNELKKAHILFVPMPVKDMDDYRNLMLEMDVRITAMHKEQTNGGK